MPKYPAGGIGKLPISWYRYHRKAAREYNSLIFSITGAPTIKDGIKLQAMNMMGMRLLILRERALRRFKPKTVYSIMGTETPVQRGWFLN
jgi:hypothetical protein